ncbi:hypothetical protein M514_14451 [Trichuris suis]|uniref:CUT domain-containing protein n=1 Tax=Trichuris suis TaxID=68888 RepID=A0A085NUG5_9BILA|nr:hypothetical protein M514_14451 [Trichuris suis]
MIHQYRRRIIICRRFELTLLQHCYRSMAKSSRVPSLRKVRCRTNILLVGRLVWRLLPGICREPTNSWCFFALFTLETSLFRTCGNNISLLIVGPSSAANFRCANDKQGNSTVAPSRKRKRSHSTSAADAEDNSYIDTKELCERISYELRSHTISQATFAARVLNRSQGTLSDLLRNPKPWNVLKSGRETFRRMYNWLQLPLVARMQMFDSSSSSEENQNDMTSSSASKKEPTVGGVVFNHCCPMLKFKTATKAKVAASRERQCRVTSTFVSEEDLADARARLTKKRRLVFSESQKKALNVNF